METLTVKNFAGLKDVTIDVKPITGFIGPQASGKSVLAKLLYFFREIASRLPDAVFANQDEARYKSACEKRFGDYFYPGTAIEAFEVAHTWNGEKVRVVTRGRGVRIEWSSYFVDAIRAVAEQRRQSMSSLALADPDALENDEWQIRHDYDKESARALGSEYKRQQIFIPAGRAFFSQIAASVFSQLESGRALDPFVVAFGRRYEAHKKSIDAAGFIFAPSGSASVKQTEIREDFERMLGATFEKVEEEEIFRFKDGREIPVDRSPSGFQEVLPLFVMLASYYGYELGRGFYIEEPETALFPTAQKALIDTVVKAFREAEGKMSLVMTTHSPYVLTSINNLLQAGQAYKGATGQEKDRLSKIVPETSVIKRGELAFYALENGEAKSIVDEEGLIGASVIDSVSDDIMSEFDRLLEAHERA